MKNTLPYRLVIWLSLMIGSTCGVCSQNHDPIFLQQAALLEKMYQATINKNEDQYQTLLKKIDASGVKSYLLAVTYLYKFGEDAHRFLAERSQTAYEQCLNSCACIEHAGLTETLPSFTSLKEMVEKVAPLQKP